MTDILIGMLRFIGTAAITIWILLTVVCFIFLVDRWWNPGVKGISDYDLKVYGYVSLCLLPAFIVSRIFSNRINKK